MKKTILLLITIFIITGCNNNKVLKDNYNKMLVSEDNINGYQVDIRINGRFNNESINEIVKVDNYMNKQYKIQLSDSSNSKITYYVLDNIKYALEDDEYVETTQDIKYSNPELILAGLNGITSHNKEADEIIAEKNYSVYSVKVKKSVVKKMLNNTSFSGLDLEKEVSAKVMIDSEGYIYKIVYYLKEASENDLEKLELNATFFRINKAREIKIDNFGLDIFDGLRNDDDN